MSQPSSSAASPATPVTRPPPSAATSTGPPATRPGVRLPRLLLRDAGRAYSAALVATGVIAVVEYLVTSVMAIRGWSAAGESVAAGTLARLLALDLTLWILFWPLLGTALAAAGCLARLAVRLYAGPGRALTWPGLLAPHPSRERGATRLAAWMWSLSISAALYVPASAKLTMVVAARFNAPNIEALLLGVVQLGVIAVGAGLAYTLYRIAFWAGRRLAGRLGVWNPVGRPAPAMALLSAVALATILAITRVRPTLAPLVPFRHLLVAAVGLFGLWLATLLRARRGGLLPSEPRQRLLTISVLVFLLVLLVPVSLLRLGAEVHTKFVATAHSPPLASLIDWVRAANDFDDDGFGSLLGETDCAPFDATIRPGVRDIPDNGVDENCDGRDFSLANLPAIEEGERVEVPDDFDKPWNILLLTIDTVRYDHTSFGGYIEKRGRDTTPRLAELVDRSVSFTDAHAPSAGTMASIPAILTSKFFHSGIALGPDRRGMPPIMKDSNLLLGEIMQSAGYYTCAILSHYYFNDWGMKQGFDTYDNEVGKKNEPYKVSSHELTDRALEWIGRHHKRKWFLWVHYIDPHGRYVAHPGETSYGESEVDLYDGELHYTDKYVGRLLDELAKIPGGERTIVVVTSDHGDGFNEHGFINHGMALYRELLHVPLIFYVPGANPRQAEGPVSPLDVVPTLAQLAGADIGGHGFEGRSLVAQIIYGRDDMDRVVFAETNYPKPLRAAISAGYKLIYDLKSNVYQLYDRREDPWEKRNVWKRDEAGSKKMKTALDNWLERVYYARDFEKNQVTRGQLKGVLLDRDPDPEHEVGASADGGRIEVVGYDGPRELEAGESAEVVVYFGVQEAPSGRFNLSLGLWDGERYLARGRAVTPASGVFPTSRWRKGDRVRVPLKIRVPRQIGDSARLVLRLQGARVADGERAVGPKKDGLVLGTVAVEGGVQLDDGARLPKKPDRRAPRRRKKPR